MKTLTLPNKTALLAAALLLACPLAASAQGTAPPVTSTPPVTTGTATPDAASPQAVTLRLKFTPGQTRRYKMSMTMNGLMLTGQSGAGMPINAVMTMTMNQTVKDVRAADGAATIESQMADMQMSYNGKPTPLPAAQQAQMKKPFTSVMLPTGKVLSVDMSSLPTGAIPGFDMSKSMMNSTIAFPDAAVKVGDTWNGEAALSMAGTKMQTTSTLTGLETKAGAQLADIDQKMNGTLAMTMSKNMPMTMNLAGTITGSGTQVFDVTAGAIASQTTTTVMDITTSFTPISGQAPPAGLPKNMKMHMQQKVQMQLMPDAALASP